MLDKLFQQVRRAADQDFTLVSLKAVIIAWAIFVIILTLLVDNKWFLAGVLAYEVLP